ncbi:MAG: hypothetical protein AAB664_03660, partial [Patescibacteria group bacterium]
WYRVDHHQIADYKKWSEDRLNVEIKDPIFVQDELVNDVRISHSRFTVINHTAFSYSFPTFYVLLKRGNTVIGVNRTNLQALDSGAAQDVTLNWFGDVPEATQVEVIPELNLFDAQTYKGLIGAPSIDSRTGQK